MGYNQRAIQEWVTSCVFAWDRISWRRGRQGKATVRLHGYDKGVAKDAPAASRRSVYAEGREEEGKKETEARLALSLLAFTINEGANECRDRSDESRDSFRALAGRNQPETADDGSHREHEGEHWTTDCHDADSAIIRPRIASIPFGHAGDPIGETGLYLLESCEDLRRRQWSSIRRRPHFAGNDWLRRWPLLRMIRRKKRRPMFLMLRQGLRLEIRPLAANLPMRQLQP